MALTYRQASQFINNGKRGANDYNSIEQPFMINGDSTNGKIEFDTNKVNDILENIPIHISLKRIYQTIGNPNVEYYYNNWTLSDVTPGFINQEYFEYLEEEERLFLAKKLALKKKKRKKRILYGATISSVAGSVIYFIVH